MLHTKFQGHRRFGSSEEDFFKVFTIYRPFGSGDFFKIFLKKAPYDFGQVVSEEKMFENVDIQYIHTTYTHTDDGGLPILWLR